MSQVCCLKLFVWRLNAFAFVCEISAFLSFHGCIPGCACASTRSSGSEVCTGQFFPKDIPIILSTLPPLPWWHQIVVTKESLVHPHPVFRASDLKENKEHCFTVSKDMIPTGLCVHLWCYSNYIIWKLSVHIYNHIYKCVSLNELRFVLTDIEDYAPFCHKSCNTCPFSPYGLIKTTKS